MASVAAPVADASGVDDRGGFCGEIDGASGSGTEEPEVGAGFGFGFGVEVGVALLAAACAFCFLGLAGVSPAKEPSSLRLRFFSLEGADFPVEPGTGIAGGGRDGTGVDSLVSRPPDTAVPSFFFFFGVLLLIVDGAVGVDDNAGFTGVASTVVDNRLSSGAGVDAFAVPSFSGLGFLLPVLAS